MRYVCHYRCLAAMMIVVAVIISMASVPASHAQAGDQCQQLASAAIAAAQSACADLALGEICLGHPGAEVTFSGSQGASLSASGDKALLDTVQAIRTMPAAPDTGEWGIVMIMLPAGEPDDHPGAITAVLFGDAQVAQAAPDQADRATLTVSNRGGSEINLRNGAGITYDVVAKLEPGESAIADGRNEQADWVRIQIEGGVAWVFTPLITWEGDLDTLEVLLPNDVTPSFQPAELFASVTLVTGSAADGCRAAPSGLLLSYTGEQAASLRVNQVQLEFTQAALLVRAAANNALEVIVLDGASHVTARGVPVDAQAGSLVRVPLGGEDGLTPTTSPAVATAYPFADAAYAPLDLLAGELPCVAGSPTSRADIQLRVGPGAQRGALGSLRPNATYPVIGWAADNDGDPWWQLDTGAQKSWVAQADVVTSGACDAVAQVEPPPLVIAPPSAPPAGAGGEAAPAGSDFAPAANSVWQMRPGSDVMTGQCGGSPPINFCDHLAAISPATGGIMWRGMEPSPYYLVQLRPNVYAYAGPNALGNGSVSITLRFTSQATLTMTMILTMNNEPGCQHTYSYTGTKNW